MPTPCRSILLSTLPLLAALLPAPTPATAQSPERDRLGELLRTAPAAPTTGGRLYLGQRSRLAGQSRVMGFDPATGASSLEEGSALDLRALVPPDPPFDPDPGAVPPPSRAGESGSRPEPELGIGLRITPSPPVPVPVATTFPWLTIYKLLMRFDVGGTDYYYVCSAWSANDFFLVTAGHCIYNHDPNGDEDTSDARWASEVWAWPGQGDVVSPIGVADHPRGASAATYFRAYLGWIDNGNFDYDMGTISLDRRIGLHTGWMGRDDANLDSLNYSGYPAETPYVPSGNLLQYYGFDLDNVVSATSFRIHLDAFIYGGHSGGPSWRFVDPDRWVAGIHSTSDRMGSAWDTRLTAARRTDINSWAAEDESVRPPLVRADVIEYLFAGNNHKGISPTFVEQGGSFTVRYNMMNTGFAPTGTITVDFYLSTNDFISPVDTYLGSRSLVSLLTNYFFAPDPTALLTVPPTTPPGTYYAGWIMRTAAAEYASPTCDPGGFPCDNAVAIGHQTLTVTQCTVCPIFGDGFESGNTASWSATGP